MTSTAPGVDPDLTEQLDRWLEKHGPELIEIRRDLHSHPELSGDEHRTTELVTRLVTDCGYVTRPMTIGTGLFADTPATQRASGPRVAIRADLDALAMHDLKEVSYRSRTAGVSHSCGHDVHTTIAIGVAQFLAAHPALAAGPVRYIFQPAEERVPGGALDVLGDGGLDDVDAVIGLHCEPKLDVGGIGLRAGSITSAADMITITLLGPGGHTARPELTVDTIALAADVIRRVPVLVDEASGAGRVKMVFGAIHGGDAANAIPTSVQLRASVRTPSLETWEALEAAVRTALADVTADTGAEVVIDYVRGVPPTINHPGVIEVLRAAATAVVGADRIVEAPQSWGGDDFAWLTREAPGAYVRLGVHRPGGPQLDLHAGEFDVDERAIDIGIRLVVGAICGVPDRWSDT